MCNTPLMYAARGNHPHSCQELLLHGADFRLHNLNGDTAHVIAVENHSTLGTVSNSFISSFSSLAIFFSSSCDYKFHHFSTGTEFLKGVI